MFCYFQLNTRDQPPKTIIDLYKNIFKQNNPLLNMLNERGRGKFLMKNKKGQDLSTSTIILLVLGVIILVILIIGFSTGWSFFKNIILPTTVDTVIQDCSTACGTAQKYSFCSADRTLRVNEKKLEVKTSCYVLANLASFAEYNIQQCPAIDCALTCEQISIDSKKGTVVDSLPEGVKYDITSISSGLAGKICVIN